MEGPFPNQTPVVDGVIPTVDVPQDSDLFDGLDESDLEMEAIDA